MQHFVNDDGFNFFRLPVGWQYLVKNQVGGTLDAGFFGTYDKLVQSCLSTGAKCLIDIHNYGRWNGGIIGQGGPSNQQFQSLWEQLAQHYKKDANIVFGIMNEPHDLEMDTWASTVQIIVTAIRLAGATKQTILLPGTGYTGAATMATTSGPALLSVKNPTGDVDNLVFDVHQYFDADSSGTSSDCATDKVSDSFEPLATWLRQNKRQAFLSEFGGGNVQSCFNHVCSALDYLNKNADVYMGWTGWAAGAFSSTYALSEVPNGSQDTPLVQKCVSGKFKGSSAASR
ncbi:MAG: hypothetical protein M1828_005376 [Chrysothrix sp. TS-e1954]|nr:MAG: hypothetical protein M1828_005376 [Chrysothrix sp. TS-e1954]